MSLIDQFSQGFKQTIPSLDFRFDVKYSGKSPSSTLDSYTMLTADFLSQGIPIKIYAGHGDFSYTETKAGMGLREAGEITRTAVTLGVGYTSLEGRHRKYIKSISVTIGNSQVGSTIKSDSTIGDDEIECLLGYNATAVRAGFVASTKNSNGKTSGYLSVSNEPKSINTNAYGNTYSFNLSPLKLSKSLQVDTTIKPAQVSMSAPVQTGAIGFGDIDPNQAKQVIQEVQVPFDIAKIDFAFQDASSYNDLVFSTNVKPVAATTPLTKTSSPKILGLLI